MLSSLSKFGLLKDQISDVSILQAPSIQMIIVPCFKLFSLEEYHKDGFVDNLVRLWVLHRVFNVGALDENVAWEF